MKQIFKGLLIGAGIVLFVGMLMSPRTPSAPHEPKLCQNALDLGTQGSRLSNQEMLDLGMCDPEKFKANLKLLADEKYRIPD